MLFCPVKIFKKSSCCLKVSKILGIVAVVPKSFCVSNLDDASRNALFKRLYEAFGNFGRTANECAKSLPPILRG